MHKIFKEEHPKTGDPLWIIVYNDITEDDKKAVFAAISSFMKIYPAASDTMTFVDTDSTKITSISVACSPDSIEEVLPLIGLPVKAIGWEIGSDRYILATHFSSPSLAESPSYIFDPVNSQLSPSTE